MDIPELDAFQANKLGPCNYTSPAASRGLEFLDEDDAVLATAEIPTLESFLRKELPLPRFEKAGAREKLYFAPKGLTCGIVTCGGLCPGINDVIRSIVMTLYYVYGVHRIVGFRYGYAGLSADPPRTPMMIDPDRVDSIHDVGGTILGSSRGQQSPEEMVDTLVSWDISVLFTIGGDGTQRGAHALAEEIRRRKLKISVIGVPKTIDNDLMWIDRSFGFLTAVDEARPAILAAHSEAKGAFNGVGVVKLMGRHSGFISLLASLANPDVNFCLIPEVPFTLHGRGGFLDCLEDRLRHRRHAVIVVAEGAGQDLFEQAGDPAYDKSGNVRLKDIGPFLCDGIKQRCARRNLDVTVKYIDPSYMIRSQSANSNDSAYCLILGQNAVHAGMAGRTDIVVGYNGEYFTHVPIELVTAARKQVDPLGEQWRYLLHMTGQPASMVGKDD